MQQGHESGGVTFAGTSRMAAFAQVSCASLCNSVATEEEGDARPGVMPLHALHSCQGISQEIETRASKSRTQRQAMVAAEPQAPAR